MVPDFDPVSTNDRAMARRKRQEVFDRGVSASRNGDFDKAIADYTEAIRLNPKLMPGVLQPGRCLREEGRIRQGHRRLHRGHPAQPEIDAEAYCNRGVAY